MTETKPILLVVDDDDQIRTQLKWALSGDYTLILAGSRSEAVESFRENHPELTLLDLGLPPSPHDCKEGLAALGDLLALNPAAKVIVISGQSEKQNAIEAIGSGACDFLCKPIDLDELRLVLRRSLYVAGLEKEHRRLRESAESERFEEMLGTSREMQEVFASIRKVAATSAPVLLLGESGTGKELAALAIHRSSSRRDKPFIPISCSGIPETLLESELFGHEKGAFTGAHVQRKGLIENAADGTLFLDEIGELPPSLQVKLLRFLQEQRFQRVGGRHEIQIDTRLVAATNADLDRAMSDGRFREDLYFRLAVVVIRLPPLRSRGDDIHLLAKHFLRHYAAQNNKKSMVTFTRSALAAIASHNWTGNVRELQNRVKRAVIMADNNRITAEDLELARVLETKPTTLKQARDAAESQIVRDALRRHQGKITSAANDLGISRPTLYELLAKLGIQKNEDTGAGPAEARHTRDV